MDLGILEQIGFTKAEVAVYLALLELGPSTSGPIIEHSGLQSSVVHRALKTLLNKGAITFVRVGKNNQYQSTDPRNLVHLIESRKNALLDILPELERKKQSGRPNYSTEMFLGKQAIFAALLNIIRDARAKEEYLSFSLIEPHDDKEIVEFYQRYNLRRREKKLDVKVLVNRKVRQIYERQYSKELLRKARVRYTSFHFPQGVIIFRDTVTFIQWNIHPSAARITNPEMAQQFRTFFREFYDKEKDAY